MKKLLGYQQACRDTRFVFFKTLLKIIGQTENVGGHNYCRSSTHFQIFSNIDKKGSEKYNHNNCGPFCDELKSDDS